MRKVIVFVISRLYLGMDIVKELDTYTWRKRQHILAHEREKVLYACSVYVGKNNRIFKESCKYVGQI